MYKPLALWAASVTLALTSDPFSLSTCLISFNLCSPDFSNSCTLALASWATCFALSINPADFSKYYTIKQIFNPFIDSPRTDSLAASNFSSTRFLPATTVSFVSAANSLAFL